VNKYFIFVSLLLEVVFLEEKQFEGRTGQNFSADVEKGFLAL
jgi:hypothetical protein